MLWNHPSAESPGVRPWRNGEFERQRTRNGAETDRGARRRIAAHHFTVHDVELLGRRLQQFGRHFDRFGPDRGRRKARRLAGHHCDAGSESAHAFFDFIRLPMGDADLAIVDAQRFGADLRDHGLHALAD